MDTIADYAMQFLPCTFQSEILFILDFNPVVTSTVTQVQTEFSIKRQLQLVIFWSLLSIKHNKMIVILSSAKTVIPTINTTQNVLLFPNTANDGASDVEPYQSNGYIF